MKQQLLLLEDVDGLGRCGEVVTAKPGFVRNFLLPQQKALVADKHTLKLQTRLKEEREKLALVDRAESEKFAASLQGLTISTEVKVDTEGRMYGSVTSVDIVRLLQAKGFPLERKNVVLLQPLKKLGTHTVNLKLKEGVLGTFILEITPEGGPFVRAAAPAPAAVEEAEDESDEE